MRERFTSYIHDRDGGHDVDGSISFYIEDTRTCNGQEFPVEADAADEPIDSPAAAADRTYAVLSLVCALAAIAFWAIAIYRFTH